MARRSIERWSDAVYRAPNASFDNVCLPASSRVSNGETRTFVLWITPFNEGLGLNVCGQAAMKHPKNIADRRTVSLAAITTTVAASRILVAASVHPSTARLPHGFERTDIIILDWIIAASAARRTLSFAN
jgi:hypothetical protein